MSWGGGPWGSTPWGGGGVLGLLSAVAQTTHSVRVTLTTAALAQSVATAGDALNPATWEVRVNATATVLPTRAVLPVDGAGLVFDVVVEAPFDRFQRVHTVAAPGLRSATGASMGPSTSLTFLGLLDASLSTAERKLQRLGRAVRDLANSPVPGSVGSTLEITSAGDYRTVTGLDFLRKMIHRRLETQRGGFPHLPDYGEGLLDLVKQPIPPVTLPQLQRDIEAGVKREPEVETVRADVRMTGDALIVRLTMRFRPTGQDASFGFAYPVGAVPL